MNLEKCISALIEKIDVNDVATKTVEFANFVESKIFSAIYALEGFDKEIALQVSAVIDAKKTLIEIRSAAHRYTDAVENFFYYSQITDLAKVKEEISDGNYKKLEEFFHNEDNWLKKIGVANKAFTEKCDQADKRFTECAELCAFQQANARSRRSAAIATGGFALTAWGTIAGLALVGMFTTGIGTFVGGSVISSMVGGSYVTYVVTKETAKAFEKAGNCFKSMKLDCRELAQHASKSKSQFVECHNTIENYEINYDFLKNADKEYKQTVCKTLDRLQEILKLGHQKMSEAKEAWQLKNKSD